MIRTNLRLAIFVLSVLVLRGAMAEAQTAATVSSASTKATQGRPSTLADADLSAIQRPPLPDFHPPQPKRIQLANGMVIFLQEDHELPLINGTAFIYGGSTNQPAEKVGLGAVYSSSWRTGGTKTKTGDELDDILEARAARVETANGGEYMSMRLSCLKDDFDLVLGVFNDLLRNPEFRQEKIELAKNAVKTGIARRNDDINGIAGREANKLGYGAQSPYARVPEYATLAAVTRQDLLDWHEKYVHPNNIILGISGDFDAAAMEKKIRSTFDSWPRGAAHEVLKIPVTDPKPGMYFVAKDDVNQSAIQMVSLGIRRDSPDYYAADVLNQVFGFGFTSRLFQTLRTKAGLAYAVSGGVGSAFDHPGLVRLQIGTKSGTTAQAIEGLYREIENIRSTPVTADELKLAKDGLLNSFIFRLDSKESVLQERMTYEFYGYPADFLTRYQKGIEAVTIADVNRVAQRYLQKDKFAVLVVGKAADFDKQLTAFGAVTNIDITIPPPPDARAQSGGRP